MRVRRGRRRPSHAAQSSLTAGLRLCATNTGHNASKEPGGTLCSATTTSTTACPYFFSDQYDVGMEYAGLSSVASDRVVLRGDPAGREFIAFWMDGDSRASPA